MSNVQIVSRKCCELAEAGLIAKGEGIYTKRVWKKMGYTVVDVDEPIATIIINAYAPRCIIENGVQKMVNTVPVAARFYSMAQVVAR